MRHSRCFWSAFFWTCLSFQVVCNAQQPWSGIINSQLATDWSGVGQTIPSASWTQNGSTIAACGVSGTPVSPSTCGITSAISGCGTNHYVLLGSGDFYLNAGITLKSNCVLRGGGANNTRLHFTADAGCNGWTAAICMAGSNTYASGSGCGGCDEANWTGGLSQGSTQITLSSVTGITTNLTPIVLDQCETGLSGTTGTDTCTGSAEDNNNIFICDTESTCITQTANTGLYRANRAQEEVVVATAITGSGPYTVTITPVIRNVNWASSQGPRAWWGTTTITNTGVEDLEVDQSTVGQRSVTMMMCNRCWTKGISSTTANYYHVQNLLSTHNVVRDSYFYQTYSSATQSYGIGCDASADVLFENNIFEQVTDPIAYDAGCAGGVSGYNFAVNQYYSPNFAYLFPMLQFHSAGINYVLAEGNIGAQALLDDIHGTHDLDTFYRNYFNGFENNNTTATNKNTSPFGISAFARYMNLVGNVLGTSTHHKTYQCIPAAASTTSCGEAAQFFDIYDLGWASNTLGQAQGSNNDRVTAPTTFRWGNYDSVTNAVHFCGNSSDTGWPSTCHGNSASITSCTESGTTVTCNSSLNPSTNFPSGSVGAVVTVTGTTVTGCTSPCYNGTYIVTASTSTTFQYTAFVSGLGTSSIGTATIGSEVPTADNYYPTSVPSFGDTGAGQSRMPSSFYNGVTGTYSSCGTGIGFWKNPTSGTCPPYPPVGPDVSGGTILLCTSGTHQNSLVLSSSQCAGGTSIAAGGGYAYANPAMACYLNTMGGPPDGTGSMLSFNRASCYAPDGSANVTQPLPPTSVTGSAVPQ